MKHFNCLHHPEFIGKGTSIEGEELIMQEKKIMDTMGLSNDVDRVRLATFQLRSDADEWWKAQIGTRGPETYTWEEFIRIFYVRFFPRAIQQQSTNRFSTLQHGSNMTVHEYHARFIQLARFSPVPVTPDEPTLA